MSDADPPARLRPPAPDPLAWAHAFEVAAGREAGPSDDPTLLSVRRTIEAGRRVVATPTCPAAWLRRAEALSAPPPARARARRPVARTLWRLVFDSFGPQGALATPGAWTPAMRGAGTARFLRFAVEADARLDLEIVAASAEEVRVRGTLDGVEGPVELDIAPARGRAVRVPVGAGGSFAATLPGGNGALTLALRKGRRLVARIGRVPARRARRRG